MFRHFIIFAIWLIFCEKNGIQNGLFKLYACPQITLEPKSMAWFGPVSKDWFGWL
jgi:hypothetical protein